MNLLQPILAEITASGERTAIITGNGERASYAALIARSEALAARWRRDGLRAGERVLVAMPVGVPLYASLVALWRLGAVAVFPEPALGLAGLRHALDATQPRAFLAAGWFRLLRYALPDLWRVPLMLTPNDQGRAGKFDGIEAVDGEHPALISFTSGSTGRQKAISRSHRFLALQNARVGELLAPRREGCVDLVGFPVFVLANLGLGITSVLPNWSLRGQERAEAAPIVRHIRDHGVDRILVPPSICAKLADAPGFPLNAIFTGGGPVYPDLLERLSSGFPRAEIISVYGSTEAEPIAHHKLSQTSVGDWRAMRSGGGLLAGKPIAEIEVRIVEGEIVVTGDHVNKGYLDETDNRDTKLKLEGGIWHRTGDAGRLDADGRLWLLGRRDGSVGGHFPFSVEAAARCWPGVGQAALTSIEGAPVLAISGDSASLPVWRKNAESLGDIRVVALPAIPLDKRHGSKVDYPALKAALRRA